MQAALGRLEAAPQQAIYTVSDIAGLGKNLMTRGALEEAVETYRFFITWYALRAVKQRLETAGAKAAGPEGADCLREDPDDLGWTLARQLLDGRTDIPAMLEELRDAERRMAESVETSKRKDDERMARIFEGSVPASTPAEEDALVRLTWDAYEDLSREIDVLLD